MQSANAFERSTHHQLPSRSHPRRTDGRIPLKAVEERVIRHLVGALVVEDVEAWDGDTIGCGSVVATNRVPAIVRPNSAPRRRARALPQRLEGLKCTSCVGMRNAGCGITKVYGNLSPIPDSARHIAD